jgi:hypothetical protein
MKTTETISTLRTQLAERRLVRQRNRRIEEELASYNTPSQRLELEAILSRHTAEEIEELQGMLNRQSAVHRTHL